MFVSPLRTHCFCRGQALLIKPVRRLKFTEAPREAGSLSGRGCASFRGGIHETYHSSLLFLLAVPPFRMNGVVFACLRSQTAVRRRGRALDSFAYDCASSSSCFGLGRERKAVKQSTVFRWSFIDTTSTEFNFGLKREGGNRCFNHE